MKNPVQMMARWDQISAELVGYLDDSYPEHEHLEQVFEEASRFALQLEEPLKSFMVLGVSSYVAKRYEKIMMEAGEL